MYRDIDFIYSAISQFEAETQLDVDFESSRAPYDVILQINETTFYGVAKKHAKNFNFGVLASLVSELGKENAILIADHLPPKTAEQLKESRINYIDASGNAFIRSKGLHIYVSGKKSRKNKNTNESRAFQEAGLKLLLVLLSDPETLQYSYRELAEVAQISVGSISHIFNELEENNFLLRTNSNRVLKNESELIEQWTIHYSNVLKPRFFRKKFRTTLVKEELENLLNEVNLNLDSGGEYAAEKMTNHLISNNFTVFSNEETARIVKELKLIPAEEGNVNLYSKFWSDELSKKYNRLAPPLVIYAELMDSGLERNIETAKMILANGL